MPEKHCRDRNRIRCRRGFPLPDFDPDLDFDPDSDSTQIGGPQGPPCHHWSDHKRFASIPRISLAWRTSCSVLTRKKPKPFVLKLLDKCHIPGARMYYPLAQKSRVRGTSFVGLNCLLRKQLRVADAPRRACDRKYRISKSRALWRPAEAIHASQGTLKNWRSPCFKEQNTCCWLFW